MARLTAAGQRILDSFSPTALPVGTTLRDVAAHYYGSYALWPLIAKASGLDYPPDTDLTLIHGDPPPRIIVPARPGR